MGSQTPALEALSAAEKPAVLDELLAAQPDLHERAEACATKLMANADRTQIADEVSRSLHARDIEELNTRAGYHPGRGCVHPIEAADELLNEGLQPFLADVRRRASLGMGTVAVELAVGILLGLYNCRDPHSEPLLEHSPDYGAERASDVLRQCATLAIALPETELVELMPEWDAILRYRPRDPLAKC